MTPVCQPALRIAPIAVQVTVKLIRNLPLALPAPDRAVRLPTPQRTAAEVLKNAPVA